MGDHHLWHDSLLLLLIHLASSPPGEVKRREGEQKAGETEQRSGHAEREEVPGIFPGLWACVRGIYVSGGCAHVLQEVEGG